MKLTFWGAAQTVTGSMHQVELEGQQYLLDCGTYQGRRQESRERNSKLPFDAKDIDCVLLSHAHIDHSGNLPTLVKNGFTAPSTPQRRLLPCASRCFAIPPIYRNGTQSF
ncbi:MAG: MBL fold metallo-hydrolase [Bryobacteraceae bacterium]